MQVRWNKKKFLKESKNDIKVPEEHVGCSLCLVCGCRPGVSLRTLGLLASTRRWISVLASSFFLVPSLVLLREQPPKALPSF